MTAQLDRIESKLDNIIMLLSMSNAQRPSTSGGTARARDALRVE